MTNETNIIWKLQTIVLWMLVILLSFWTLHDGRKLRDLERENKLVSFPNLRACYEDKETMMSSAHTPLVPRYWLDAYLVYPLLHKERGAYGNLFLVGGTAKTNYESCWVRQPLVIDD